MQPRKTMTKETKAKKIKKANKKANCDSENILFQVMISYKPAHEVALWRVAVHLIKFLKMYIRVGINSWLALPKTAVYPVSNIYSECLAILLW